MDYHKLIYSSINGPYIKNKQSKNHNHLLWFQHITYNYLKQIT